MIDPALSITLDERVRLVAEALSTRATALAHRTTAIEDVIGQTASN